MCGRFVRKHKGTQIANQFQAELIQELPPSYNIAPTHDVSVVVGNLEGGRRLIAMRWGLIPRRATDPRIGARMINARGETLEITPAFREPFKNGRCLVIASGFYEWQKIGKAKVPMLLKMTSDRAFAFAGLYDVWKPPEGPPLVTCTIITTEPNEVARSIHDRMPVILQQNAEGLWLDPQSEAPVLRELLKPYPSEEMEAIEVSSLVNSVKNDSPECIEPVDWSERLF